MKNRNGFTFVEMLAVVAIVGLLLGISTFAISKVLDNSRKEIYLASVKTQLEGVKLLIESEEYDVYDENTTYYFDYHLLKQTDDIRSPYGDWVDAYVVVTYNGEKLKYYWTGIDTAGWRIDLRKQVEKMTKKDIYNKAGNILAGNSLEGKDNIVVSKVNDKGKEVQEDEELSNHLTAEEADLCYEYEMLDDNTCRITNYKESCGSDVNMPSSINGSVVTKIGRGSFRGKNITSVTLYDGVEVIELGAFQDNAINKLKLSKSIKKIEDYAFYKNQIPEVSFPEGLTTIGSWGFANNKIKKVLFPESLKTIGPYAFYGNLLTEITFNSNPTLGGAAFSNNKMPSSEGILYLYDATTKQFDYSTIIGYCTDVKDLVIPPEVNGIQPKRIKSNAFANSGLTSVRMPDSIEVIESDAFAFNSIATVNLSTSLKTIGTGAFRSNDITHIDIPPTVTSIGNYAFVTNRLTGDNSIIYARNSSGIDYTTIVSYGGGRTDGNITIPAESHGVKLKLIKSGSFADSKLKSITPPDLAVADKLTIENDAFIRNKVSGDAGFIYKIKDGEIDYSILSSYAGPQGGKDGVITIPKTKKGVDLKSIQASFGWMSFKKIVVPETVTSISASTFSHSNRNNVNFKTIVNKTNKSFDWYGITSSSITPRPAPFVEGTIEHQSGNIVVEKG